MSGRQTVNKSQLDSANAVLEQLREAISPEYLGLISTTGHPITVISSSHLLDEHTVAALAASAFGVTRQLAAIVAVGESTDMLHESGGINICIAQVTEDILLILYFRGSTEIGRARLLIRRAIGPLAEILKER